MSRAAATCRIGTRRGGAATCAATAGAAAMALTALATGVPAAHASGGEVFCSGTTEIPEKWPVIPAGGIPFSVSSGPGGTRIAPGFPPVGCLITAGANVFTTPGVRGVLAGAAILGNVTDPSAPGVPLSTFALDSQPGFVGFNLGLNEPPPMLNNLIGPDGINLVNFWEPSSSFNSTGGPMALAVTATMVVLSGPNAGDILEADIAVNTLTTDASGRPFFSFVDLDGLGRTFATAPDASVVPPPTPVLGYADVQGVVTHELAHLAGLGHSLVDSSADATGSRFPTMFPLAQVEPFTATATLIDNFCAASTVNLSGAGTNYGGIAGRSARSLEAEDRSNLAALYPTAAFTTVLGSIRGKVTLAGGQPVLGAHVVAFRRDQPDVIRVGSLAMAGGNYSIDGLPPGEYFVYAEPVDQGGPGSGAYFNNTSDPPNYVLPPSPNGGGCVANPIRFAVDVFDSNESFAELSRARATAVTVAAGQVTGGVDIGAEQVDDLLRACLNPATGCALSSRGLQVAPPPGVDPTARIRVQGGPGLANRPVVLAIDVKRTSSILDNQLLQLPPPTGSGLPLILNATTDSNGMADFDFPIGNGLAFTNFFVQAAIAQSTNVVLTNSLDVYVANP